MRLPRLLTVLALVGFSLACGGMGGSDEPTPPVSGGNGPPPVVDNGGGGGDVHNNQNGAAAWTRYANSDYDYCDAKILAGMWGSTDISEAKSAIGQFLADNERELLENKLGWARDNALSNLSNRSLRCHYDELGFTYDDAVALSTYWGIDSWEAKMRIEEKYLRDGHSDQYIREALNEAGRTRTPIDEFIASNYDYCDAKILAGMWGDTDVYEAKEAIGQFLLNHEGELLESKLGWAREGALENLSRRELRCHYDEFGFSYEDAVALGEFWGIDSWEAKMRIEEKYLRDGHSDRFIQGVLRRARRTR